MKGCTKGWMAKATTALTLAMIGSFGFSSATAQQRAQFTPFENDAIQGPLGTASGFSIGSGRFDEESPINSIALDESSANALDERVSVIDRISTGDIPLQSVGVTGSLSTGEAFTGSFAVSRFGIRDGQLVAYGRLLPASTSVSLGSASMGDVNVSIDAHSRDAMHVNVDDDDRVFVTRELLLENWVSATSMRSVDITPVVTVARNTKPYAHREAQRAAIGTIADHIAIPVTIASATCNSVTIAFGQTTERDLSIEGQRVTMTTPATDRGRTYDALCDIAAASTIDGNRNAALLKELNKLVSR
ncbi:MAG: hypothetical protein H7X80_11600 [bacterium]|nr:hypothetical protein [Candidatus Kapabacteria bacterium]